MSALVHQPRLLRLIARTVRDLPWLGRSQRLVASRADVVASFERPLAFSSIAHQPNLVAGEFVIGMESGERHTAERLLLARQFPRSEAFERSATQEARARVESLLAGSERTFDLIDDYMVPVAWQAISGAFAGALPTLPPGDPMFLKLRYLGAHLIVGPVATEAVHARARESAVEVNAWVRANLAGLHKAWSAQGALTPDEVARTVVGMLWVGHPATVQSGGLVMQELLERRRDPQLRGLFARVQAHPDPWGDVALRSELKRHVLELLRLRPTFPMLTRVIRRDTFHGADGKGLLSGGKQLVLLPIGAMSDPAATPDPLSYRPDRSFTDPRDLYLNFGWGARQCPGRDPVIEILTSALMGLLQLPQLDWAEAWWRRIRYDGPIISSMRLTFRKG